MWIYQLHFTAVKATVLVVAEDENSAAKQARLSLGLTPDVRYSVIASYYPTKERVIYIDQSKG